MWVMAFQFLLPFTAAAPLLALLAAAMAGATARPLCAVLVPPPPAADGTALATVDSLFGTFATYVIGGLAGYLRTPLAAPGRPPCLAYGACLRAVASLQLLLGGVLPMLVCHAREAKRRDAFLAACRAEEDSDSSGSLMPSVAETSRATPLVRAMVSVMWNTAVMCVAAAVCWVVATVV